MRKICTFAYAGVFCAAVSAHALAAPPEEKGKPTSIPSHFIHFPTPKNSVGVVDVPRPGSSGNPGSAALGNPGAAAFGNPGSAVALSRQGNGLSPSDIKVVESAAMPEAAAMPEGRDSKRAAPLPECR